MIHRVALTLIAGVLFAAGAVSSAPAGFADERHRAAQGRVVEFSYDWLFIKKMDGALCVLNL